MVSGRKHIFKNVTPWFIFTFWHVPWIAYEYWRGFKSPSAAAVQACFTRCTVSHVQQKRFIMKSIFSRYPCFVINDNNYLCLYTSDTVSRIVKGVFSVAPPHKWTKYKKRSSFISESSDVILSVVSILRDPVTWSKKKTPKKMSFDSDPP